MDIGQHVNYWTKASEEDFAAAESLLEKAHLRQCLFLAHLAVEKMLKAHVTAVTKNIPPRIHDLVRLSQIAVLELDKEQKDYLNEFGVYQLEGRYPDSEQMPLDRVLAENELSRTRKLLKWLKAQLPES